MNMQPILKPFPKKKGKSLTYWNGKLEPEVVEALKIYAHEQSGLAGVKISQARIIQNELLSNKRLREIARQIKREKRNATKESNTTSQP
jgi:hypothetical protein